MCPNWLFPWQKADDPAASPDAVSENAAPEYRPIGFWAEDQPIIGECGEMPWRYRPWFSYVVLPQPEHPRRFVENFGGEQLEVRTPSSGIVYMDRPIEELEREELLSLIIGQDFVIERLLQRGRP